MRVDVTERQSKAAKNSKSWLIEKYNARLQETATGIEHIITEMIDNNENGLSLFNVTNFMENYSLSSNLL